MKFVELPKLTVYVHPLKTIRKEDNMAETVLCTIRTFLLASCCHCRLQKIPEINEIQCHIFGTAAQQNLNTIL